MKSDILPSFSSILSKNEFYNIINRFRSDNSEQHNWKSCVEWLKSLSKESSENIDMNGCIVIDESMIPMYHKPTSKEQFEKGKMIPSSTPPLQKIARKLRGIGVEAVAAAVNVGKGFIVNCELVSSSEKEFQGKYSKTTARLLRVYKAFKGSGITVIADAGFGSVESALALEEEFGLKCIMAVKTHTCEYPL